MRNVDIDDLLHLVVVMPVLADYLAAHCGLFSLGIPEAPKPRTFGI